MSEDEKVRTTAIDASGNPVVDPTKNVLDLVAAAIQRQDDLRLSENRTIENKIDALKILLDAKINAVDREFSLIEDRRVEQKVDTKIAVDAALSAAEKAVKEQTVASEKSITKSETSAAEQSKQQNATFAAALKGVTDTVADLKERIGKIEARVTNQVENKTENRLDLNTVIAVLALISLIAVGFIK
jgi:hypothetical protein